MIDASLYMGAFLQAWRSCTKIMCCDVLCCIMLCRDALELTRCAVLCHAVVRCAGVQVYCAELVEVKAQMRSAAGGGAEPALLLLDFHAMCCL